MTTLLVASTGGHLEQLVRLRPRLGTLADEVVWATFDAPQSRSRLAGADVVFMRHTGSRGYRSLARNLLPARRLLRDRGITAVVSTGAGIALAFMPTARALAIPCYFIESAARSEGPSLTGRVLRWVPGVHLHTQYEGWARGRWSYAGSVFEGFRPTRAADGSVAVKRVVVTLGTIQGYDFRRVVERLLSVLPRDADVLWQTGATDVSGLGIHAHRALPANELDLAMEEADVVIAHAGIGSALSALDAGRSPLLVPRRAEFGEHVDDHQEQIAAELHRRGLAIAREADELTLDDIQAAARMRAAAREKAPPLMLTKR